MHYLSELHFVEKLLQNMNLSIQYLTEPFDSLQPFDQHLEILQNPKEFLFTLKKNFLSTIESNTIYQIQDAYFCNFLCFLLPDTPKRTIAYIGPYRLTELNEQNYLQILNNSHLAPEALPHLKKFYEDFPFFTDEQRILHIVYALADCLWGDSDHFCTKEIRNFVFEDFEPLMINKEKDFEPFATMKHLEERYALENQILQAVSQGQTHKAELLFSKLALRNLEKRSPDSIRNLKNYCIIMNTLLRKAAEQGAVHPIHIDNLSSKFAHKIETASSTTTLMRMQSELIHRYCLLVKNHSLHGYSSLIRSVLTHIDSDLTADLSLRTQANLLNINSSYLSTLFKKEVGMTLTDYVNNKRIEHAIFLLNTTTMQIQTIAQHCGIMDVNYFTKTFKKHIGKTPKEYRDSVMSYKRLKLSEKASK